MPPMFRRLNSFAWDQSKALKRQLWSTGDVESHGYSKELNET